MWKTLKVSRILVEDKVESGDEEYFTPPKSHERLDHDFEDICCCTQQGFLR